MEEEQKPLVEQVKDIKAELAAQKEKKSFKNWRLPLKARVGRKKAKKNWIGVVAFHENKFLEEFIIQE